MKKIFLLFIACSLVSTLAQAQIESGAIAIGGTFSINSQNSTQKFANGSTGSNIESDRNSFQISPRIGYFISNSMAVGLGIRYQRSKFERVDVNDVITNENTLSEFFINPYLEKYIGISENLFFISSLNVLVGSGKSKQNIPAGIESDINTFNINLSPGFGYFISKKFLVTAIFGELFYQSRKVKDGDGSAQTGFETTDNTFGLNTSFDSFALGIRYFIGNNSEK